MERSMIEAGDQAAEIGLDEIIRMIKGGEAVLVRDLVLLCSVAKRSTFREGSHLMQALMALATRLEDETKLAQLWAENDERLI